MNSLSINRILIPRFVYHYHDESTIYPTLVSFVSSAHCSFIKYLFKKESCVGLSYEYDEKESRVGLKHENKKESCVKT